MSLFLGKIHFWLFNKIKWFENLEGNIISLAKEEDFNIEELIKEVESKFGERLPNKPLDELIDKNNIHGWLQAKIHSAEKRTAFWTKLLVEADKDNYKKLEMIYDEQGKVAAYEFKAEGKKASTPKEIFNAMNDYILDGMPCDRVNEVIVDEENMIQWKSRICVHKEIWEAVGCDVNYFYDLRNTWIKSFVYNLNNEFAYTIDNEVKTIKHI